MMTFQWEAFPSFHNLFAFSSGHCRLPDQPPAPSKPPVFSVPLDPGWTRCLSDARSLCRFHFQASSYAAGNAGNIWVLNFTPQNFVLQDKYQMYLLLLGFLSFRAGCFQMNHFHSSMLDALHVVKTGPEKTNLSNDVILVRTCSVKCACFSCKINHNDFLISK